VRLRLVELLAVLELLQRLRVERVLLRELRKRKQDAVLLQVDRG